MGGATGAVTPEEYEGRPAPTSSILRVQKHAARLADLDGAAPLHQAASLQRQRGIAASARLAAEREDRLAAPAAMDAIVLLAQRRRHLGRAQCEEERDKHGFAYGFIGNRFSAWINSAVSIVPSQ